MVMLFISLCMLIIAPAAVHWARTFEKAWYYTENALIGVVTSLVVLHLLPESIRVVGFPAVLLAFTGLFLPSVLERLWRPIAARIHFLAQTFALSGLFLHGLMDGAALVSVNMGVPEILTDDPHSNFWMQMAVIIHRLPAAMFIWTVFSAKSGKPIATALLGVLGIATVIGYSLGQQFIAEWSNLHLMYSFQALVAGSLLHIAFDRHGDFSNG
ncbi:MAG: hypothetical protein OXT67_02780 [Zetaproteobacteria bacterium]|nr:hypothetical protein [Zetaproteobacteria bacterium]